MSKVTGILERANSNDAGYWSINVGGKWYSTYRDDHTAKQGSMVEFEATEVEKNGRTYSNAKNVKVTSAPAPAATGGGAPMSADARQQSIVMQSSYRTAADIITAAVTADAVPLGNKKSDRLDILLGFVDDVALRLYHNCIDPTDFLNGGEDPAAPPADDWNPMEA